MKICTACQQAKEIHEFYQSKTHAQGVMCYCKSCFNIRCQRRWMQRKLDAINYKGNQCPDCRLHLRDSHYAVFEFHHLDPAQKELDWSKLRLTSTLKIRSELDKCILLCANCHRIRHATMPDR